MCLNLYGGEEKIKTATEDITVSYSSNPNELITSNLLPSLLKTFANNLKQKLNSIFGDLWRPVLKQIFEKEFGLEVKSFYS